MIHIPTTLEFRNRTGILFDYEFEPVDIVPDTITGLFLRSRLDELIEYCEINPEYHIVSILYGSMFFNRILENATLFCLAGGDKDTSLVCFEDYRFAQYISRRNSAETNDLP